MAYYLPTTVTPVRSTSPSTNTRILQAQFGDGYTQRAGDGINTVIQKWDVQWVNLDSTDSDELIDFFEARGGYESFRWIPPGSSLYQKFICKQWSETHPGNSKKNLNASFDEVFDLD